MLQKRLLSWLSQNPRHKAVRGGGDAGIVLASDRGLKRADNQDRIAAMRYGDQHREFVCCAVADGMGGLRDGAECAEITIAAFFDALIMMAAKLPWDRLEQAVHHANSELYSLKAGSGGSTLSAILIESEREILAANIGDSRIYVERNENGSVLDRVTVDDSLEEAFGGQGRELLQFVGIGKGLKPHISRIEPNLRSIAITTDGIHFLDSFLLETIYSKAPDPRSAADRLLALSRWFGGPDNATIAILSPSIILNSPAQFDTRYAEFWNLDDTIGILLGPETQNKTPTDTTLPRKDNAKRRGNRRQKANAIPSKDKPEQLKIDIELEQKNTDGSNS